MSAQNMRDPAVSEVDTGDRRSRRRARRRGPGLSGKLLLLTLLFVMLSEVLIYVPSIANFRRTWLEDRFGAAQLAALVLEAAPDQMVPRELELELLREVGADVVAHKRGSTSRLIAISAMPPPVDRDVDLRVMSVPGEIRDAFDALLAPPGRMLRIVGAASFGGGTIEIVMPEGPLRSAMFAYSANILTLSLIISAITGALVYFSMWRLLVRPMRRLTGAMVAFSGDPEDASRIITPSGRADEIGIAERELAAMQSQIRGLISQKSRLAALGLAVSKINHDLRNLLASAQLMVDRVGEARDPVVQRIAPRLVRTLDRAIAFCTNTLKYGSAGEAPPQRRMILLADLVEDVGETLGLSGPGRPRFVNAVDADLEVDADPEQLLRVLINLVRNAVQALESVGDVDAERDMIRVSARRSGAVVTIEVADTGPGIPERARPHLFEPFKSSTRPGGAGLGLAIAAEIVRAHGGSIRVAEGTLGATLRIDLPDRVVDLERARFARHAG